MNNPEFELLVYLITSAKALPEEPACPENDAYRALLGCIDADKGKALTEPEGFAKMLEKASEMLVDCL